MARRKRRKARREGSSAGSGSQAEGTERYMWAFSERDQVVLSIPGLRDLRLTSREARTVGEMLIETADDALRNQDSRENTQQEVGD